MTAVTALDGRGAQWIDAIVRDCVDRRLDRDHVAIRLEVAAEVATQLDAELGAA